MQIPDSLSVECVGDLFPRRIRLKRDEQGCVDGTMESCDQGPYITTVHAFAVAKRIIERIAALEAELAQARAEIAEWSKEGARRSRIIDERTAERDLARTEVERLRLQSEHVDTYWEDGDAEFDSPETYAMETDAKVGAEFELQAAAYWKLKFRVTKVPDDKNDDYECEQLNNRREEFPAWFQMKQERDAAIEERDSFRAENQTYRISLHERNEENDSLRSQLEAMSKSVSDEEWKTWRNRENNVCGPREATNAILAARARQETKP